MPFKRAGVRYSETPEPVTPYQAAQQMWDDRIGSARVQAHNWRRMAFGSLGLSFLMAGGLLWQTTRSIVLPYIVEVDRQGAARAVGQATEIYRPTDAQIAYHLSDFVNNIRSLPLDPIVLRDHWLRAYNYVTPHGAVILNDYARIASPFTRVGRDSVAVEVASIVRASASSFQLRWVEHNYTNGSLSSTDRWTGIFSIVLQPPRDEERIRKNPLGIYVDGLNWSKELDSQEPGERR